MVGHSTIGTSLLVSVNALRQQETLSVNIFMTSFANYRNDHYNIITRHEPHLLECYV